MFVIYRTEGLAVQGSGRFRARDWMIRSLADVHPTGGILEQGCAGGRPSFFGPPCCGASVARQGSRLIVFTLATTWSSLGKFAELLGNSIGGGKGDGGIANGGPAELFPDGVDGPIRSPSACFDFGSGSGSRISPRVDGIER